MINLNFLKIEHAYPLYLKCKRKLENVFTSSGICLAVNFFLLHAVIVLAYPTGF